MTSRPSLTKRHFDLIKDACLEPIMSDDIDAVDPHLIAEVAPFIRWFCEKYYRLTVEGLDSVPSGKALIVGNHNSGVSFYEAMGVWGHWYTHKGTGEIIHSLAHDAVIQLPVAKNLLIRCGTLRASHESAHQAFSRGRKVQVFPGGNLEAFRSYKERNRIVFGNRKGFVKLAIREQVPIIPVVYVGGHEGFFILNDGQNIAKKFGLNRIPILRSDTWPLMLTFPWGLVWGPMAHIPLPTKCSTRFLDPIPVDQYSPEDEHNPQALQDIYDQVVDTMQYHLSEMSCQRRFPILG